MDQFPPMKSKTWIYFCNTFTLIWVTYGGIMLQLQFFRDKLYPREVLCNLKGNKMVFSSAFAESLYELWLKYP